MQLKSVREREMPEVSRFVDLAVKDAGKNGSSRQTATDSPTKARCVCLEDLPTLSMFSTTINNVARTVET